MQFTSLQQSLESLLRNQHGEAHIEPVLNWGGFVKSSFTADLGDRKIHLKLAKANDQTEMRRWLAVHEHLTRHYHAPRVLGWIDVPHSGYGGLIFEHVDAPTWDLQRQPELAHEIVALLRRLHDDEQLLTRLNDAVRTLRECWD